VGTRRWERIIEIAANARKRRSRRCSPGSGIGNAERKRGRDGEAALWDLLCLSEKRELGPRDVTNWVSARETKHQKKKDRDELGKT